MTQYCYLAVFFFLVCHTSGLTVAAETVIDPIRPFEKQTIDSWISAKNGTAGAHYFRVPLLFSVKGGIIAAAAAGFEESRNDNLIFLLSKFRADGGGEWKEHAESSVFTEGGDTEGDESAAAARFPLKVLAIEGRDGSLSEKSLQSFGYVSEIVAEENSSTGLQAIPMVLNPDTLHMVGGKPLKGSLSFATTAVVTKKAILVVPFQAINENGRVVSTVIYSEDDKIAMGLHSGASAEGCRDPTIVDWEGEKLLMVTPCDDGYRRVYEFTDNGKTWTEALGTLSRVWGNSPKRSGPGVRGDVITVTVEDKKVMLFTHPTQHDAKGKNVGNPLHLWLTDVRNHIVDVGPISDVNKAATVSALLHKDGKLFSLYELGDDEPRGPVFTELTAQLERIKTVVKTWKDVDNRVSQLCHSSSAVKALSLQKACNTSVLTNGLVGYLSGTLTMGQWKDEYLGVNATVYGEAKVTNDGVRFKGPGAGAQWPVGEQGQNQLYHFANYNFILLAAVTIHQVPKKGSVPLMGVRMNGSSGDALVELLYDASRRWEVAYKGGTTRTQEGSWEPGKTYQVAVMLRNGKASVYVDAQSLVTENDNVQRNELEEISHFYIGGLGGAAGGGEDAKERDVTVSNVLLYNRPLTTSEIKKFASKLDGPALVFTKSLISAAENAQKRSADGSLFMHVGRVLPILMFAWWGLAAL